MVVGTVVLVVKVVGANVLVVVFVVVLIAAVISCFSVVEGA